jgi:hypothetical protein
MRVLKDHPLSASGSGPDITVQPQEAAEYPSQVADGDPLVAVAAGEMITERQALEALLLPSAMDDRSFADITSQLRSAQDVAGDGFGFTWPASFPVVRIDQILVRGVEPDSSWVLPGQPQRPQAGGSQNQLGHCGEIFQQSGIGEQLDHRCEPVGELGVDGDVGHCGAVPPSQ